MRRLLAAFWIYLCISFSDAVRNVDTRAYDQNCEEGYKYDMTDGCQDVNECLELPCKTGQVCRNLMGSFTCLCPRGYKIEDSTGDCEDIDECEQGYCGKDACINTNGSYTCVCPEGMKKIGRFCRDVNECIKQPCNDNEYCINTRGSFRCICKMGFERRFNESEGVSTCHDTDECASNTMCKAYGETCMNTPGSYKCMCQEGYVHDASGRYCKDLNECDLDSCPHDSECINTYGSFYCRCHRGFTMDNGKCVDNRDCSHGEGKKCLWKCVDVPGSFQCACPSGYDQSDFTCVDINECDRAESEDMGRVCNKSEMCINTRGGYQCIDKTSCPSDIFYRKLTRTDEFGRRQYTTNTCRRRCRQLKRTDPDMYRKCKKQPMSVASHYIDITSRLPTPRRIFRIRLKTRRRRQKYAFEIVKGDETKFGLKQVSKSVSTAYLMLKQELVGPSQHEVKVDMTTYNKKGKKRDNRMVTLTIFVSEFEF